MRNKSLVIGIFLMLSLVGSVIAVGEVSFCCEKLAANSAWCQNAPEGECDAGFKMQPTSCESTSYCKLGTCVNSIDGTCLPNSPEAVCDLENGVWKDAALDEIPQCQLGCCLIGDQAAFVTQTRCGHLAAIYGLEINFRSDITSETQCIMSAGSEEKGACVFDQGAEITCRMTTKTECLEETATGDEEGGISNVQFHEGFLCSAEELGALCSPSETTTCVEGKDEVYFVDTCGNVANVYDHNKLNNQNYWTSIVPIEESCGYGESNANSNACGNCDYMLGSTCAEAKFGDQQPVEGDYICKDLSCEFDMNRDGSIDSATETFEHGEAWCYVSGMYQREADEVVYVDYNEEEVTTTIGQGSAVTGTGSGGMTAKKGFLAAITEGVTTIESMPDALKYNLPGTRHFRLLCYNGEVMVEPCADYRNEICVQGRIDVPEKSDENGFKTSACRLNQWQDCIEQTDMEECEDLTKRDCLWYDSSEWGLKGDENQIGMCVPLFAPGYQFWGEDEEGSETELLCSRATDSCTITYEKKVEGLLIDDDIIRGKPCATNDWQDSRRALSVLLGDCGNKDNYLGYESYGEGWRVKQSDRGKWD